MIAHGVRAWYTILNMNDYNISWTAPEYEHHEHSAGWYWALGIISVSLAVAFVIVGNTLLSIIIILGMGTLLAYAKHPPRNIQCSLSKRGLKAGEKLYPWETLESFWVLEGSKEAKYSHDPKILLTSKKPLTPHIVVPLDESVIDDVHRSLARMLPEEPQVEPLPARLMRRIGF